MKTLFPAALLVAMMSSSVMAQDTQPVNTKTIRAQSGAQPTTALSAGKTALIVIDIQNEYYAGKGFRGKMVIPDGRAVLENSKKLVDFAHKHHMPVYFVRHVGAKGGPLFAEGSVYAEFHQELQPTAQDAVIAKATPSAFVATDLDAQLKKQGVTTLLVAGLMTHMCVSSTARDAVPLGYSVLIAGDATATRDLDDGVGGVVDHRVLQRAALAGVADVFAEIHSTQDILSLPVSR
ncbi:cysteine hydrolase family protein [Serratia rubidaea]|uniref:cysteine hydrolase family protein n=1 Tax=Serratia rubidaea TaxID=61652 RepID=UPI0023B2008D|nr:cysteine hydrolase family protein [Serratia rubidaea]MDK1704139.1 cysteine hydrolase family protein [Serratia rubidaea]